MLIAMEVLTPGMGFKGVKSFINNDFPESTFAYIQRIQDYINFGHLIYDVFLLFNVFKFD